MTKFWLTIDPLTKGIVEVEGEYDTFYLRDGAINWHRSLESAQRRAELMRDRKIASLKKQIAKLEAMKF